MAIIEQQKRRELGRTDIFARVGGTGTAGTLPMSEKEKKAAAERKRGRLPIGFAPRA